MKPWIAAALLASAFAAAPAPAAEALVLLVGGPAGNPGDLVARALSAPLAAELGQPVVVENRPGAAGTIALAAVARARPDGNTLGVLALQQALAPALIKALPYDTLLDLQPVRQLTWVSNVLVVRQDSPYASLQDVLAAARAGALSYASGGNGTPAHLAGELLAHEARVPLQHVPFAGAAGGVNAVLGGHVQLMFATAAVAAPQLQAGRLRALAASGTQRQAFAPDVPTLAESGLPAATVRDWHGLVAPAGTPAPRVRQLAQAVGRVLALPEVRQRLATAGMEPAEPSDPQAFGAWVQGEVLRWGVLARSVGMTLQ